MNRVAKVVFVAAASLAVGIGTAIADDDPQPAGDGSDATTQEGGGEGAGSGSADANGGGADTAAVSGAYTKDTWPLAYVDRPVTLAAGMIQIHVDFFANLSSDAVFKPFALAPDIYYGVNEKLTAGLTHGIGLCLAGTDNGCAKVYDDVGVDVLYALKHDTKMDLAAHVGAGALSLDGGLYGVHLGVLLKYQMDKIGIYADPSINVGLTKRDDVGNKESLAIPVMVAYQASPNLAPFVRTGIGGFSVAAKATSYNGAANLDVDGAGFGDTFAIPLGIGAIYAASNKLDIGAEFGFPGVAGSDFASTDLRYLLVSANLRL